MDIRSHSCCYEVFLNFLREQLRDASVEADIPEMGGHERSNVEGKSQ